MSNSFIETFKSYANAVLDIHPKYSTKKYHDRAVDTINSVLDMVFDVFEELNSTEMDTLDSLNLNPINDDVLNKFKKSRKVTKKSVKTLNIYTALFIPIVKKFAEPILVNYDNEEPGVDYNRITSINSIASKIYKNLTDPNKYSDTYEYDPDATEGKTVGVIVSSVSDPADAEKIRLDYQHIVAQLSDDKSAIENELEGVSEEDLKETKKLLVDKMLESHADIYDQLEEYILSFMDRYKEALHDLCVNKPLKKNHKATSSDEEVPAQKPVAAAAPEPMFKLPVVESINLTKTVVPPVTGGRAPKLPQAKKVRKSGK